MQHGYDVSLVTLFTPEQLERGRILSNQCMWRDALQIERELGLALWDDVVPPIPGFDTSVIDKSGTVLHRYPAPLSYPGQSIDQRLKFAAWIRLFVSKGGKVVYADVGETELEDLSAQSDLVVVATGKGKGAIKGFFERDDEHSAYREPMRYGASFHVKNRVPDSRYSPEYETWAVIPDVGEFWIFPTLTVHGPGHVVCVQGVPKGPLDVWASLEGLDAHLATMMALLQRWLPDEAERCRHMEPVDPKAWLSGGVTCVVNHPVRRLSSGRHVLALGDSHVLNDPISQQGSNNATLAARVYLDAILAHEDRPYDAGWMRNTAGRNWTFAQSAVRLTETYLESPDYFRKVFTAAARTPSVARMLADSNNDVIDFMRYLDTTRVAEAAG